MFSDSMIVLVNFGGPRDLPEIFPFLKALLQDRDVIRTKLPTFLHNWLFQRVAKKRSKKIAHDYLLIGGKSPIYFDTEEIAQKLQERLDCPVIPFHRYLPATHKASLKAIEEANEQEIRVLPLFPQFSYSTTGSIARILANSLSCKTLKKLRWIKSYAKHPAFIKAEARRIADYLKENNIPENETFFLFSAHGLPQSYICRGDIYQIECEESHREVMKYFPKALSRLSYQSKFGPAEWIRPYTDETCESILSIHQGKKHVVIVPISFTSDHIETLFEIEKLYLPLIQKQNLQAHRCPALNLEPYWLDALAEIVQEPQLLGTQMLIRNESVSWCCRE